MEYVISSNRWKFNEHMIYTKDNIDVQLDYNAKSGTIVVELSDKHDFGTTNFDSRNFEDWTIDYTGDEYLEDWGIITDNVDDDIVDKIYLDFDSYIEGSDDYYDFREYIEFLGWEFKDHYVIIDEFEVEEIE
jgi:hypothetical protein